MPCNFPVFCPVFYNNSKTKTARQTWSNVFRSCMYCKLSGLQGLSFHTIWMWICGSLVHVNKNCRKLQILIGIIPIFSENFIQNKQVWPQLQPKTWSEAILRIYKSAHHFIIDSLQKCILEAVIDCLEIQSWLKGEIVPNGMSSLSMAASKMHFWRLSMIKWCALL